MGQSIRQTIVVNFSVFNELSLPLDGNTAKEKFGLFFGLLKKLSGKGLSQIRMSDDFKDYRILKSTTFQQFLGQCLDRDFKTRLKSFIGHQIVKIDTPIIQENDKKQIEFQLGGQYFYNMLETNGGLACCDIWNTIAISFDSDLQWRNKDKISITKKVINENADIIEKIIQIKHASSDNHLQSHEDFFSALKEETKQDITKKNLWNKREKFFPNRIVFCPEVENQIKKLDKTIFDSAISILIDVEKGCKEITNYCDTPESQTVSQNPALKKQRMFTINGQKKFFTNHIKSLPNKNRMYFLEEEDKIYIGYIGKHLPL